ATGPACRPSPAGPPRLRRRGGRVRYARRAGARGREPLMTVAIIGGTGDEGFGLAVRLGRAGVPILIGSRAEDRGRSAAAKAREVAGADAPIDGTSNEAATAASDVVLVTVPFAGQAEIYRSIKDAVRPNAV